MEVFEIKKSRVQRQASTTSSGRGRSSRVGYILTMAGIVLATSAILVVLHFFRGYVNLSEEIKSLSSQNAEKLERKKCDESFCNTRECVFVAAAMLESLNLNKNPCNDFYEYACGGYSKVHAIPYASNSYSPVKEAQLGLLIDIRKIMDSSSKENEAVVITKMRKFYNSCINSGQRDEFENRTFSFWLADNEIVSDSFVFGSALNFDLTLQWTKIVSRLEEYRIHTLFKPKFITVQGFAPEKMEVDCIVPFLNPKAYSNMADDELAFYYMIYKEAMNEVLELLHLDRNARKEFIEDVLKIESDIASAVMNDQQSPHSYLSEQYQEQLKEIWRPVVGNAIQEMEITSTCKYDLQSILLILNEAPNQHVIKYIIWRMLMELMQYMSTEFRNIHIHYMTKLPRFDYAYESKWKECADTVQTELGLIAMKSLFDYGYIQKEIIDDVNAEFSELKRDMALIFSTMESIDEETSKKFLEKIKHMKLVVGNKEIINQDELLDSLYENLEIDDNYFSNIINIKRFKTRKYLTRLWYGNNNSSSKISLDHNPLGSTSHYDYITNTVYIDLGLLRTPIYMNSRNIPIYLKYGYSSILAHEMSKAFDAIGSFYDANGQQFEKIWWASSMEQKYNDFLSCISNQLSRISSKIIVDFNDTYVLNSAISDLGSFFIPYERLKKHLRSLPAQKLLPGISLNKKQTFYVQTAQMFCELRSKRSTNSDASFVLPSKYRVNNAISNMEDFGSTFNCRPDDAMISKDKCSLLN